MILVERCGADGNATNSVLVSVHKKGTTHNSVPN